MSLGAVAVGVAAARQVWARGGGCASVSFEVEGARWRVCVSKFRGGGRQVEGARQQVSKWRAGVSKF